MSNAPELDDMHNDEEMSSTNKLSQNDPYASLTDKVGNPFDPEYHKTNADGTPDLTKDGFAKRPAGGKKVAGKKMSEAAQAKTPPHLRENKGTPDSHVNITSARVVGDGHVDTDTAVKEGEIIKRVLSKKEAKSAAAATTTLLGKVNTMAGGKTFGYIKSVEHNIDERKDFEDAFSDYYYANGKAEVGPGIALVITLGLFYGSRVSNEEIMTQAKKESRLFRGISRSWQKFGLWRKNRKIDKDAERALKQSRSVTETADMSGKGDSDLSLDK